MASHIVEWYTDIYISTYGLDTTYSDIVLKFNKYLKQMVNTETFDVFSNVILTIGVILLVFHLLTDLAEKAAMNQLSTLQMGKSFVAAIGTVFVMYYSKQIFILMLTMVESLNAAIQSVTPSGNASVTNFLKNEAVQTMLSRCVGDYFSLWDVIGYTVTSFIMMLISLVAKAYVIYFSATRAIELFLYMMFMPIGVSDIFENGPGGMVNMSSRGARYMKTMLAIMLQLVVITVVSQSYNVIVTEIMPYGSFQEAAGMDIGQRNYNYVMDPLYKLRYTDHHANILEIAEQTGSDVWNKVKASLNAITSDGEDIESPGLTEDSEKIKPSEIHKVMDVVNIATGEVISGKEDEYGRIMSNSNYRMTVDSTQNFFDYCTGTGLSGMVRIIIIMVVKILMIAMSSNMCNELLGTNV